MAITPNYTVVGSPTIDEDYVLTGTDANNYLTFNEDKVFDATKSYDIIFKFRTLNPDGNFGILELGFGSGSNKTIAIYSQYGEVYAKLGRASLYIQGDFDPTEEMYYKISYDSTNSYAYAYYSADGENWVLAYSRSVSASMGPGITTSNNRIGRYNTYYLRLDTAFIDLTELVITSDGNEWYKAIEKHFDPVVTATDVFSSNKTFKGKKQIVSLDCNNVQFVNNDMSFAFVNCSNLTRVTNINQNTTNMAYAFAGCNTALYDTGFPTIPNSVNDITGLFAYHTDWTDIPVQAFVNAWSKIPAHLQTNVAGFLDGCTNLSNVPSNTLPNFMTNIAYAFRNCQVMTDMPIITENVVDMSEAFSGCTNMVNVNYEIPNSVVNMSYAFSDCKNITSAPDMSNATNVRNVCGLFKNCWNLVSAPVIPNNVNDVDEMFNYCNKLVTPPASFPNTIRYMNYTFYNCHFMTSAPIIPNSVIDMNRTFWSCQKLETAPELPNSVINMYETFSACRSLINAPVIPDSVVSMYGTFYDCQNMTNIPHISNSVVELLSTFSGCSNLKTAPVIPNGVINMNSTFYACTNLTTPPVIPNSVTAMNGAFGACYNLKTLPAIPDSVIDMCSTFYKCTNLTTPPVLPNSVININAVVQSCNNLTTPPVIPNGVKGMSLTFAYCNRLSSSPVIPNSVENMYGAFMNCNTLTTPPDLGNLPNLTNICYIFSNCTSLSKLPNVSDSVINGCGAFNVCNSISSGTIKFPANATDLSYYFGLGYSVPLKWTYTTSPTLPQHLTNGVRLFQNWSRLVNTPIFPSSLSDANAMFITCTNLTQIDDSIEQTNITNIESMFSGCSNLVNPIKNIPSSVTNAQYVYHNCFNLASTGNWSNVDISGLWQDAFRNCYNLTTVESMPNSAMSMTYTFQGCSKIKKFSVNFPYNLKYLDACFINCSGLETIESIIPNTVNKLYMTFENCTSLTGNIYIQSEIIDNGYRCFNGTSLQKNVYIPFTYANGSYTQTYNTLVTIVGYKTDGSVNGVYIKDINQL